MTAEPEVLAMAEEVMPGAVLAQIAKFGKVGSLHQPMSNGLDENEPVCPECFGGIFAVDPGPVRPCGCWGLLRPICGTCAVRHQNGHWRRLAWPCPTWQALVDRAEEHADGR